MELLWVPVVLWVVTSLVPSSDAFARIPICNPPSPLSCIFPSRAVCVFDETEVKDEWRCENIFSGALKVPPSKKPIVLPKYADQKGYGILDVFNKIANFFKKGKSGAQQKTKVKNPTVHPSGELTDPGPKKLQGEHVIDPDYSGNSMPAHKSDTWQQKQVHRTVTKSDHYLPYALQQQYPSIYAQHTYNQYYNPLQSPPNSNFYPLYPYRTNHGYYEYIG